ncbi:DUF4262 domain-containing protein [Asticcacaulis excentricus]|uniref:DUF4262 domain-containing protein n=1 Tax=Asticcacaulis TaxID=76890 RepID=UPI000F82894A|nr:DUF4262 domain-containing protein [Asticcacaulis excentricus]
MTNALDRDDKDFSDYERKIVRCVREYGWFATSVLADQEGPDFTYSIGFEATVSQPEIIMFSIKHGHDFLGDIYSLMKNGKTFEPGIRVPEILRNLDVVFLPVDKRFYSEYPLSARWFYGHENFALWQMVWPDHSGFFPWQDGFAPEFAESQPDLSSGNWGGLKAE